MSTRDARWQDDRWFSWRALELGGILDNSRRAAELHEFILGEKDHRLGARFERLIEYGLTRLPGYDCIERRLQVHAEGRTVGEFDFLVQDRSQQRLEHWEVACKFYLGVPQDGTLHWVGPGKRDSLVRKLTHLTDRQLSLGETPAYQRQARQTGPISGVRAILKGRLFYPLARQTAFDSGFVFRQERGPIVLNPRAPRGFWCNFEEFSGLRPRAVYVVNKADWLDPQPCSGEVSLARLERDVETAPQCVDVVTADGRRQRGFVVRPDWFADPGTRPDS